MPAPTPIANVISTGGGGTTFEHQVAASFLSLVLTHSYIPVFPGAVAAKLHLQAGRLGWKLDDFLVEAVEQGTIPRKLAAQVKRSFTLSEGDEDCCQTMLAAWADFHNASLFNRAYDALLLIVHLGTNRILGDFTWLLQQARTSTTAADFAQRLAGQGTLNRRCKGDYDALKSILAKGAGAAIDDAELWAFLRCFYVLSYDLTSSGANTEAGIRTLLAQLATGGEPADAAATTWAELKGLVSQGAGTGASYTRADLPPAMQARHHPVGTIEHHAITAIRAHSDVVLGRVADAGAQGLWFARTNTATDAAEAVEDSRVTLIVGPAGGGKSVLAKRLIVAAGENVFTLVFAAEEFRAAHIDNVLANAQIGVNWKTLRSLLALQPKKVILLEGLERLLESDDRGALNDLLHTVAEDPSFHLVMTCRDYHAQTIEWVMLGPNNLSIKQVIVPELTDAELDQALEAFPQLAAPLSSPPLRRLLKNPFMLNQAAAIEWRGSESLPSTEKALRERLWKMVVRRDHYPREGMPARRAQMLTMIALTRARSLRPFVEIPNPDQDAVTGLAADNLLAFDTGSQSRAAPAHDVFEDWALVEWLHAEFARFDGDVIAFAKARDAHPALRRAYRRWLNELIQTQSERARDYIDRITRSAELPDHLRDDTLIAVFQSADAEAFLRVFSSALLAQGAALLQRVMHLVRVSCKTVSPLSVKNAWDKQWHVPIGKAWPNVLDFLLANWGELPAAVHGQILEFIHDWAQGVNHYNPYPEGAVAAGAILEKLWPVADDSWGDDSEKLKVLTLMLKAPNVVEGTFKQLVERRLKIAHRREDREADLFGETLMRPFEAAAASRDFPQETMAVAKAVWKRDPPDDDGYYSSFREVESVFGLKDHLSPSYFPASALQGPFKSLFQHHPRLAIAFVVELLNDAAELYGKAEASLQYVEPPEAIDFTASDGKTRQLWSNDRLWCAYRSTTVMPDVLECALMAMEAWFLELIKEPSLAEDIRYWLKWVLRHSNNVSTVAVVASVCTAYPRETLDVGLALLACRPLFALDRDRMVKEATALAPGGLGALEEIFQKERLESNRLPHRRKDLERFATELQLVDQEKIWAVLDAHRAVLPPLEQQDDEDKLWRLALTRMDLRGYTATRVTDDGQVFFQMSGVDADIKEVVDRGAPQQRHFQQRISLLVWASNQFEKKPDAAESQGQWHEQLKVAKQIAEEVVDEEQDVGAPLGGIGITAAVCLRDHWDELTPEDLDWCINTAYEFLLTPPGDDLQTAFVTKSSMGGIPPCAYVMPLIWMRRPGDSDALGGLIAALCHYNQESRLEAIRGVSEFVLRQGTREGAFCTWVLVTHAQAQKSWEEREAKKPFQARTSILNSLGEAIQATYDAVDDEWFESYPDLGSVGFGTWSERELARCLLRLFANHQAIPEARAFFVRIASALKTWWGVERRQRQSPEKYDYDLVHSAQKAYARFLLQCDPAHVAELLAPVLDAVHKSPKGMAGFMGVLLSAEDNLSVPSCYWEIWSAVANKAASAPWLARLDDQYADGQDLISDLFLNTRWKEGIQVWSRLGDHYRDIDALFQRLPPSSFVLKIYAHYLYHVGRDSMPQALVAIVDKFGDQLGIAMSAHSNIRWYFNTLLSRAMYSNLARLKETQQLRSAVIAVLDALVNAGSSIAFRLRDDFVTPSS